MRTMLVALLGLMALLVVPHDADAAGLTGAQLYEACNTPVKYSGDDELCLAYTTGVMDGMYVSVAWANIVAICLPKNMPSGTEDRLIAEKFMREHPEKLGENAAIVVAGAIANAFQCPR